MEAIINLKTLLELLWEVAAQISGYISGTTKAFVKHVLGLFKSFYPSADVKPLAESMAGDCSEKKILEVLDQVEPVAYKIVDGLDLWWWLEALLM